MPTNVESAQQVESHQPKSAKQVQKLGARAVVELLKHNQIGKPPAEFNIIETRNRDALESLLQLLTRFQLQIAKSPYANASVVSLITKYLVENSQCLYISKPDLGAIHLVDNIFDQLLNSEKLDREAWCLLAQTRFPITKFALQDFSFFFAPQNIGRKLLNSITLNLLGSAVTQKDQVRQAISRFVDQLNTNYKSNVSEFNSVGIEMQAWFASQQQHLNKVETKVTQVEKSAEEGDRSEPLVIEFLNKEVGGKQLPQLLVDFIYGEWRNSLRLAIRQEGERSASFKRQMSLTQSMVQIHDACKTEDGQSQYTRFLPSMLKGIKGLLLSVLDSPEALEEAFDPLELILNALVRGADPEIGTAPVLQNKSVVNETYKVIPVDEKYLKLVDEVGIGDWIRIKTKGQQYEACRLTVKGEDAKPWVFVNNTGSKIAKKNRYALAQGVSDGVIELVGKGQWIDDLLRGAFNQLSQSVEAKKSTPSVEPPILENEPSPKKEESSTDALKVQSPVEPEVEEITLNLPAEDQSEPELETEPEAVSEASEDISLVSMDEQQQSYHTGEQSYIERTDEILSGSALSIVSEDVPAAAQEESPAEESNEEWAEYYSEEQELSEDELNAASNAVEMLEVGAIVTKLVDGKEKRCKLAVKMKARDKFVFVDPLGIKVWDTNSLDVAKAIATGEVSVIDSGVKFDRALEQVVMNIQADKKGRG